MASLLLDTVAWDLCVDANGNIAVASAPYADAQDAACAIRLFKGDLWSDTTQGVPYWTQILGQWPPVSLLKAELVFAASSATHVISASAYITSWSKRIVSGIVEVTNDAGQTSTTSFSTSPGINSI